MAAGVELIERARHGRGIGCPAHALGERTKRDAILTQMESLKPRVREPRHLDRLAEFLADIPAAWETATHEQRNKLAKALFDQVWLQDKAVVAVKPRLELEPFFALNYEEFLSEHQSVEGVTLGNYTSGGKAPLMSFD